MADALFQLFSLSVFLMKVSGDYILGKVANKLLDLKVGPQSVLFQVEPVPGQRGPFRCYLDTGLARTSKGARIFGVLKGSVDGGMAIPHKYKRFPGYTPAEGEDEENYDAAEHRRYIFGQHVADYMKSLMEEDDDVYKRQFSRFIKNGISPDNIEALYSKVHAAIRANPEHKKAEKASFKPGKRFNAKKLTYQERFAKRPRLEDLQDQ